MQILGIDSSTNFTGFCVLNARDLKLEISHCGLIDTSKFKDLFDKLKLIEENLIPLEIPYIFIEEPIWHSINNQKTVVKLAQWNILVQYVLKNAQFAPEVHPVNALKARKFVLGTLKRGINQKEQVKEAIFKLFDKEKIIKAAPIMKRKGIPNPKNVMDITDSVAVAYYGYYNLLEEEK